MGGIKAHPSVASSATALLGTTLVFIAMWSAVPIDAAADLQVFKGYPLIQCSACESIAKEIGRRMNITAANNRGNRVLKSHRLENIDTKADRILDSRRTDYESSELRAVEVLEILCQDVAKEFHFVSMSNGVRVFSHKRDEEYSDGIFYSTADANALGPNPKARLMDFCEEVMESFEDLLTKVIRRQRTLDGVISAICLNGMKLCDQSMMQAWMQRDALRKKGYDELKAKNPKVDFGQADNDWVPPGLRRQRVQQPIDDL